ncbi:hypothetical protein JCM8115_006672 [Rhodotorula mucilaginosa]|uniref:ferric-chelate reductase (NADPH) n=1 Tax=Rhodotorula mucilaginosa TaxID=5537 RepID=A0A9P6W8J5_RHOMI|nr:hypothetical protein C6P46_002564 [Rhodotorula mucilaginosa]TKA55128.1 hypothetical protein B0A53_02098 [Rhodotorula sp. CCFEE 5036]
MGVEIHLLAAAAQTAAQKAAKAEKTRQKALNLLYTNIYAYLIGGILGAFVLRNLLLQCVRYLDTRRRNHGDAGLEKQSGRLRGDERYAQKAAILRWSERLDHLATRPVRGFPIEWTYLRFFLVTVIVVINTVFCIVGSTHLHSEQSAASSIARAFSRRCGRMAVANYPILFCFAGRNSVIARLTGFEYQTLRFYHMLLGAIAFILSFIHTFAYIAHYTIWQGVDHLREEFTETYFKWGIVALVFLLVNCVFGLKWLRRRSYEIFLALHVIGAALILAGTWYHRPITQSWVYAAVGIWVAERVLRLLHHFISLHGRRIFVRAPVIKAKASVVAGAIKLAVPARGLRWAPGQHCYISFWGLELARRPWLYGPTQAHPFSVANVPSDNEHNELRFVMRIHDGITSALARTIEARAATAGSSEVDCYISLEGPHGRCMQTSDFDTLLLIAGGSGITHPLSMLEYACAQAAIGETAVRKICLVWALHRLAQVEWIRETLETAGALAAKANIDLEIKVFVTRSEAGSLSGSPSLDEHSDEYLDEKGPSGEPFELAGRSLRFRGRPDVHAEVASAVSDSGRTLVVACGPPQLARDVAEAAAPYSGASIEVEIAKFEC